MPGLVLSPRALHLSGPWSLRSLSPLPNMNPNRIIIMLIHCMNQTNNTSLAGPSLASLVRGRRSYEFA